MARKRDFPWLAVAGAAGVAAAVGLLLAARHNAEAAALDTGAGTGLDLTGGDAGGAFGAGSTDMTTNADDASKTATYTPGSTTISLATGGGLTGSALAQQIMNWTDNRRETAIEQAVLGGNVPPRLAQLVPVQVSANGHAGEFYAMPDYLGVGTEADWLRTPLYPTTAQRIADAIGAVWPTRKMVDLIWQQAPVRLPFHSFSPENDHGPDRDATARYVQSQQLIEADRAGRAGLVADPKKSIVIGNLLARYPHSVQIYGGRWRDGSLVQPPSGSAHNGSYTDYSHGIRYVAPYMTVDGQLMAIADVLRNADLAPLISDEGIVSVAGLRYPTA